MTLNQSPDAAGKRIARLHERGVVDLHFDLPMHLYEQRDRANVLATEFLPGFEVGGIGVVVASVYLEDRNLPAAALPVALDQIARLYREVERCERFAICKSNSDIECARAKKKIALLIGMEGVEPLGSDLDLVRAFYELGLRVIGLTHARRNAAAAGAVFAASGSPPDGLTEFGRALIRECQRLGILVDLAHLNPAGVDELLAATSGPLIISHTTPREFYNIERNSSDEHIRAVGRRGGLVGANAVLVSPRAEDSTLDSTGPSAHETRRSGCSFASSGNAS